MNLHDNSDTGCVWDGWQRCGWPGTMWFGRIRLCVSHYEEARRAEVADSLADSFIYFARIGDYIKIGRSRNVSSRVKRLQFDMSIKRPDDVPRGRMTLLHAHPMNGAHEDTVHRAFMAEHVIGEWFRVSPNLLAYIDSLANSAASTIRPEEATA